MLVQSESDPDVKYILTEENGVWRCTCPGFSHRGTCKHAKAAQKQEAPMGASYNKVILAGNLTRNPETRVLGNENCVCNFGLAVNRKFKGRDGQAQDETTFVDCEAWGRTAELIGQYLSKGSPALIDGRLKTENWEAKDGQKRSKLKVVVEQVQFIGAKREGGQSPQVDSHPSPSSDERYDDTPPF